MEAASELFSDDIIDEMIVLIIDQGVPPLRVMKSRRWLTQWLISKTLGRFERRGRSLVWIQWIKERKLVNYDRERVLESIMSDWFHHVPRFCDHQVEQTLRLKRRIVEPILSKLDTHDPLWTSIHDCYRVLSISPIVKFLTGQKWFAMVCHCLVFKITFKFKRVPHKTVFKNCQEVLLNAPNFMSGIDHPSSNQR